MVNLEANLVKLVLFKWNKKALMKKISGKKKNYNINYKVTLTKTLEEIHAKKLELLPLKKTFKLRTLIMTTFHECL